MNKPKFKAYLTCGYGILDEREVTQDEFDDLYHEAASLTDGNVWWTRYVEDALGSEEAYQIWYDEQKTS